jgi:ribosomal protein S18 acetylase RimI-like enzyme
MTEPSNEQAFSNHPTEFLYSYPEGATQILVEGHPNGEYRIWDRRFSLFVAGAEGPLADKCRQLESMVFGQEFKNTPEQMDQEYGPYERHSRFLGVIDHHTKELAGCVRVMAGDGPEDFKTINDDIDRVTAALNTQERAVSETVDDSRIGRFHQGFDSAKTWEIGTLAVAPNYRGRGFDTPGMIGLAGLRISTMLYHSLYVHSHQQGIDHWLMMIDKKARSQLLKYGVPVTPLCGLGPREYLGSGETYPQYVHVPDVAETIKDKQRAFMWILCKGLGVTALCDTEAAYL